MTPIDLTAFDPDFAARLAANTASWGPSSKDAFEDQLGILVNAGVSTADDAVDLLNDARSREEWAAASVALQVAAEPRFGQKVVSAMEIAEDPSLREWCIAALGAIRGPDARAALVNVVDNSPSPTLRAVAVNALGRFDNDDAVVPTLLARLDDRGEVEEVRAKAATALANASGPEVAGRLITALDDESMDVRFAAAEALARIGDSSALDSLRRMAVRDAGKESGYGPLAEAASFAIANITRRMNETSR